jgi:hypothetical protein
MMATNLGLVINDHGILALIVLVLFGGFAMMQGGGLDRKVAIMVPAAILAIALVPWLLLFLTLIVGAVIFYPLFRRLFA